MNSRPVFRHGDEFAVVVVNEENNTVILREYFINKDGTATLAETWGNDPND